MRVRMQIRKLVVGCALLAAVSAMDLRGQERISPHETSTVTLAGQQITITYGRPSIRNRKIMGSLVPYGSVWRTGADEATMLMTPVDLNIGGVQVPAGKYTLWTLPSADTWKLIINKQTGQWGTNYDQGQDLARVDMHRSQIAEPVNEFTIVWQKNGERAANLVLEWENTRVTVGVRAK